MSRTYSHFLFEQGQNEKKLGQLNETIDNLSKKNKQLQSKIVFLNDRIQTLESDLITAGSSLTRAYDEIIRLRRPEILDYYNILDRIKTFNSYGYSKLLLLSDPLEYTYTIENFDRAYNRAKSILLNHQPPSF